MRVLLLCVLLSCGVAVATAAPTDGTSQTGSIDTFRVGSHVLSVGDSAARVIELLGKPVYKEPVENRFGAYLGERWQYRVGEDDLTLVIRDARIVSMRDVIRRD